MPANIATGSETMAATPVATQIDVGFDIKWLRIVNADSGDSLEFFQDQSAAAGYKRVAAGTGAVISSGGITIADGNRGFIIGLDSDINAASEVLFWVAIG